MGQSGLGPPTQAASSRLGSLGANRFEVLHLLFEVASLVSAKAVACHHGMED